MSNVHKLIQLQFSSRNFRIWNRAFSYNMLCNVEGH
jgi:hypothetical protein